MTINYGPALDAEIAYRRARITHDHQVANGWSKSGRRLWDRLLANLAGNPRDPRVARHAGLVTDS